MNDNEKQPETGAERANADVARERIQRWRTKIAPLQYTAAQRLDASGAPNSAERTIAQGLATTDSNAAFANAGQRSLAANAGQFGQASQKLGIARMGNDQALSRGLGTVRTNQAVDDARISGLNQVMAMGQGQAAQAASNLGQAAAMSGQQAAADAELSAQKDAGYALLAGQMGGFALGAASGRKPFDASKYPLSSNGIENAQGPYVLGSR